MPVYYYGSGNADERLQHFLDNPPEAMSLDVETISIKEPLPLGFALAFSPDEAFYFQLHPEPPKNLHLLKPLLFNPRVRKVIHNALFDLKAMPLLPELEGLDRSNLWDTNVAARLLGYLETSLYLLAPEVGMEATPVSALLKPGQTMLDLDSQLVAKKCQQDAKVSFALYLQQKPKIEALYKDYFKVEMQVIPILIDLSNRGLKIDQRARARLEQEYTKEVNFYTELLQHSYGVEKPTSTQQVGYILAKRGNFLPFTRSKKQLTTKESELEFLDDPMAAAVLGFRKKSKFLNTYIRPIEGQDRFYTEFYLDTVVGRLNSRNRNIQNIPSDARHIFLPDSGIFTTGDYSQEHLYILMHFSGDRDMRRVYDDGYMDGDIHKFTAGQMNITRKLAKTINYGIVYGATPKTISEQAKIKDRRRCARLLDDWFRTFSGAADWIRSVQREGLRAGWAESTLFGRHIKLPDENEDALKRKAVNYPILGSDGEIIKRAIIYCSNIGYGPPVMAVTVHDSITFDGSVRLPLSELEMIPGFRIPFEVKQSMVWE